MILYWAFSVLKRVQLKMPKMRLQWVESSQAISGSISFNSYAVLGESLFTKGNHVMPCISIIWKKQGFSFDNMPNFELISKQHNDWSWWIYLTSIPSHIDSFQSNSITSQNIFLFNLIYSGVFLLLWIDVCFL